MRIRCIRNELSALESENVRERLSRSIHIDEEISELDLGVVYAVAAIETRDGGLWFFIQVAPDMPFPHPLPAELFEVVDDSVPVGWSVAFGAEPGGTAIKRISFPAWANDSCFYERLVDGDARALTEYRRSECQNGN